MLKTQRRFLVYLRDGKFKARGLKKPESEYLSVNGVMYPGDESTIEPAKQFLGSNYELPNNTLLQAITHKSFAHGKKPFNENLAILGKEYLRLQTYHHAVSQASQNTSTVNGLNFDVLPRAVEVLSSSPTLAAICEKSGIASKIFWKQANDNAKLSGSATVYARAIHALVGAVLVHHGEAKAAAFVSEKLLSGEYNAVDISAGHFNPRQ